MLLLWLCAVMVPVFLQVTRPHCPLSDHHPADPQCCSLSPKQSSYGQCFCTRFGGCLWRYLSPSCCGSLKRHDFKTCLFRIYCVWKRTLYQYVPSVLEKTRRCQRMPGVPAGSWPQWLPDMPDPLPGPCYCRIKSVGCSKSTSDGESTESPPDTTPPEDIDSTTTVPPTINPVCLPSSARMLGGLPVKDSCALGGIVNFRTGDIQVCNGFIGYDTATDTSQLFITEFCGRFMEAVGHTQATLSLGIYDSLVFEINTADVTYAANHIGTVAPPEIQSNSSCEPAVSTCVFDPHTMNDSIDLDSCFIASSGYDHLIGDTAVNSGSLRRVAVSKQKSCKSEPVSPGAQCFVAVDTSARACWGDSGAPVLCAVKTSSAKDETVDVLYGLVDIAGHPPQAITGGAQPISNMCSDTQEFHVIPIYY